MELYHLHIYYSKDQTNFADKLLSNLKKSLAVVDCSPLINRMVGPHTSYMFEVTVEAGMLKQAVQWIDKNRDGLSVLIHPIQEDEYEAHTSKSRWLGEALPLKLDQFGLKSN